MPPDHGHGLHDQQGVSPGVEHSPHEDPEDAVTVLDSSSLDAALENNDLLAKGL